MHWINTAAMLVMITSGSGIYDDDVIIRGFHFSSFWRLGDWAVWSLNWHFAGVWFLTLNGLVYLVYGVVSGRLRERLPPIRMADLVRITPTPKHTSAAMQQLADALPHVWLRLRLPMATKRGLDQEARAAAATLV
jgi:thiosulfate reductase cytochrome b subunit